MPHSVEAEAHLGTYRSTDLGSDSKHATNQRTQSPGKAWVLSARSAGNAGTLLSDLQVRQRSLARDNEVLQAYVV